MSDQETVAVANGFLALLGSGQVALRGATWLALDELVVDELLVDGAHVVALGEARGRGRVACHMGIHDGQVTEWAVYVDPAPVDGRPT